jgi:transposase
MLVKGTLDSRLLLEVRRLGPLPILNSFLARLDLDRLLGDTVPTTDARCALEHAKALGVLLRTIVVEREPIYRHQETVSGFDPTLFGLAAEDVDRLTDDSLGRSLDRLFDADRAAFVTKLVVTLGKQFDVRFDQLHNDSTTIRLTGQYRAARGRTIRGRRAPWVTYGHSKEHRPDLKQLLFILTTTSDGGVPVQFRCADGNQADVTTHVDTWETLRQVAGRPDFLYVADSKLCSREVMEHIDREHGRLVTVLPRSRSEDPTFREWMQKHEPEWELVWNRPNPRRRYGPRDRWWVFKDPIPSVEVWPIIWVRSSLLARHQEEARRDRLARAGEELMDLKQRLASPRSRLRKASEIDERVEALLRRYHVARYVKVQHPTRAAHGFKQRGPGRPSATTTYRRTTRRYFDLEWSLDEQAIAYDRRTDGVYPLLTNDKTLTPRQVLEAHKGQPTIEKRFEQVKTVHQIAPVFLKNEGRIEALFVLYFVGLLVQALIERELRRNMRAAGIKELPIYPEERLSTRPTTEQVLRLFSHVEGHVLRNGEAVTEVFQPNLTDTQREVLRLLGVPSTAYHIPTDA